MTKTTVTVRNELAHSCPLKIGDRCATTRMQLLSSEYLWCAYNNKLDTVCYQIATAWGQASNYIN